MSLVAKRGPAVTVAALTGVLLAGVALRLAVFPSAGLWIDECVTYWAASAADWREVIGRSLGYTTHPPMYFLLIHGAIGLLGASETTIRLPSLVVSMVSPLVAYLAMARLTGRRGVGLMAALLLAMDPVELSFCRSARPYAFVAFLAYGSVWQLAGLLPAKRGKGPGAMGRGPGRGQVLGWLAWAGWHAALMQCNYAFALLAPVQVAIYLVLERRGAARAGPATSPHSSSPSTQNPSSVRPPIRPWLLGGAALALLTVPWLPHAFSLVRRGAQLSFGDAPSLGDLLRVWTEPAAVIVGWIVTVILASAWARLCRRRKLRSAINPGRLLTRTAAVLLSWHLVPTAMLFVVTVLTPMSLFQDRYAAAFRVALPAIAAWLWGSMTPAVWRRAGFTVTMLVWTALRFLVQAPVGSGWVEREWLHDEWRGAVRTLCARTGPEDVVLFDAGLVEGRDVDRLVDPLFVSYLQAPLAGLYGRPQARVLHVPYDLKGNPEAVRFMDQHVGEHLRFRRRVWVLVREWGERGQTGAVALWLDKYGFRLDGQMMVFQGPVLSTFVRGPAQEGSSVGGDRPAKER